MSLQNENKRQESPVTVLAAENGRATAGVAKGCRLRLKSSDRATPRRAVWLDATAAGSDQSMRFGTSMSVDGDAQPFVGWLSEAQEATPPARAQQFMKQVLVSKIQTQNQRAVPKGVVGGKLVIEISSHRQARSRIQERVTQSRVNQE
jgi:hypothetical protein